MLETRLVGTSGMLLTLVSLVLGPEFWGYQTGIILLQTGILALGLGLFLKINKQPRASGLLQVLDDIEVENLTL